MTSILYPGSSGGQPGPNYGYAYDTMGRLSTMTNLATSAQMITGTTYDPANRLLTIIGGLNESRVYNGMGQLTHLTSAAFGGSSLNITYNYSSTQNNGKIASQTDNLSGEQVVYTYDSLNRLASAGATNNSWGQSYAYDGFGNLTDQTTTAGGLTELHVVYNASTNRQTGDCADANGNINSSTNCTSGYGYDVENRLHPPTPVGIGTFYSYAPGNKRVWRGTKDGNYTTTLDELTFWGVNGQKLATYNLSAGGAVFQNNAWVLTLNQSLATANTYFGGKIIANGAGNVVQDRLGSIGKYYPWGQEKPSATQNGTEKFTGYFRDSETGLDYAMNRYHQPGMGRFLTADPYRALSTGAANPGNPGSWNRYAYVGGDPINAHDPMGLDACPSDDPCSKSDDPIITGGDFYGGSGSSASGGPGPVGEAHSNAVFYAIGQAEERLFKPDCAGLFLAPDSNNLDSRRALSDKLQSLEDDNLIRIYGGTAPGKPNVAADTTDTFGLIRIFDGGPFFSGKTSTGQPLGGAFQGMSLSTFQQLTIIHEFMHWMGIVGPDDANQSYTLPNGDKVTGTDGISAEIRKKCF